MAVQLWQNSCGTVVAEQLWQYSWRSSYFQNLKNTWMGSNSAIDNSYYEHLCILSAEKIKNKKRPEMAH